METALCPVLVPKPRDVPASVGFRLSNAASPHSACVGGEFLLVGGIGPRVPLLHKRVHLEQMQTATRKTNRKFKIKHFYGCVFQIRDC